MAAGAASSNVEEEDAEEKDPGPEPTGSSNSNILVDWGGQKLDHKELGHTENGHGYVVEEDG